MEPAALNTKPKQHTSGSSQTAILQLYHFASNKHHLGLTSILLIHRHHSPSTQISTSATPVGIFPYPFFSCLTLTTRRKTQKTQHLLRLWHKLRSPVELRSSWHTFLTKTIKLQPHHPTMREERPTTLEDSRNSLSEEQQISFEWCNQSKTSFVFHPLKPQGSPVQSVLAEIEGSASSASQQRPRWWHQQRCAAGWPSAALQPPATAPAPVGAITVAGLAST